MLTNILIILYFPKYQYTLKTTDMNRAAPAWCYVGDALPVAVPEDVCEEMAPPSGLAEFPAVFGAGPRECGSISCRT